MLGHPRKFKPSPPPTQTAVYLSKLFYRQLGAKEQELQVALQRQERYQQSVQDVTARMERVHSRMARGFPGGAMGNLDQQLKDYKVSRIGKYLMLGI